MARTAPFVLIALLLALPVAAAQNAERSRTQGLKETDRFVKAGESTVAAVANAKLQTQKTLDAYNALVTQPTTNMKGDYKKLMKSMDGMNARVSEAQQKIEQMRQSADVYFAGRSENLKGIQDPQLQDRAKQRLTESQEQFGTVVQSLRDAGQVLDLFRKELADHITYLGSDLTPSAMTSLKPDAEKFNARGQQLLGETDKAIAAANPYFQGLRSSQS